VQTPGRDPDIEILGVVGHRLQQVQQMHPQDAHFVGLAIGIDGQPLPKMGPAEHVAVTYLFESPLAAEPALGPGGRLWTWRHHDR